MAQGCLDCASSMWPASAGAMALVRDHRGRWRRVVVVGQQAGQSWRKSWSPVVEAETVSSMQLIYALAEILEFVSIQRKTTNQA